MYDDDYLDGDAERDEAQSRIDRIRGGGGGGSMSSSKGGRADQLSDELRGSSSPPSGSSRASAAREAYSGGAATPREVAERRGRSAFTVIGAVVGIGILVVIIIVLAATLVGGGGSGLSVPFLATKTPTPTATPPATETPLPTETPTPTREAPDLALPPLTCIFQSGADCVAYCQDSANAGECNSARSFVEAQGADADAWFDCLGDEDGEREGNPQLCLEDAWRVNNP